MKPNIIKRFFIKLSAKQLRKPSGLLAKKAGIKMNEANAPLYELTFDTMKLADNDAILEIGFGNGHFFDTLFSKARQLKIAGLDFSKEMVAVAAKKNEAAILNETLTLQFGSSDKIPFADNSFDKIFCINVIYFWEQPNNHLKEIYRVLKPAGKFYTTIRSKETMLKMPFTDYGFTIYTQQQWADALEQNNLKLIDTTKRIDAGIEINGERLNLESLCIIAEKK